MKHRRVTQTWLDRLDLKVRMVAANKEETEFCEKSEEVCLSALMTESVSRFQDLTLNPTLLATLDDIGYVTPTPIQAAFIPHALNGLDVIGQAQTGTGKTAAFLLPFLNAWREDDGRRPAGHRPGPDARTRRPGRRGGRQAVARAEDCRTVADLRRPALSARSSPPCSRAATSSSARPAASSTTCAAARLTLDDVRYVVLDEADRMLDIGFRPDIERILRRCPRERQTLLLSATLPPPVHAARAPLHDRPASTSTCRPDELTVDKIRQTYITVDEDRKFDLLLRVLIEREKPRQCIIFCERKRGPTTCTRSCAGTPARRRACTATCRSRSANRIMEGFRDGKITFLIATDVVGRGIDVTGISHVINYDLPDDPENYVHRIGRTGRMGKDGVAIVVRHARAGRAADRHRAAHQQHDRRRPHRRLRSV